MIRRTPAVVAAVCLTAAAILAACSGSTHKPTLDVSVGTLLQGPFADIAKDYADATLTPTYATDAALAAAVRAGKGGDVVVSSDLASLTALNKAGLVQPPAVFGGDRILFAYHGTSGTHWFPTLAAALSGHLRIEAPTAGSDFANATAAAIASLPSTQRSELQTEITSHAATSARILADVLSGKVQAGLVLQSEVQVLVKGPASRRAGLRFYYPFGAPVSYAVAVVNPAKGSKANAARQRAAAEFVYSLIQPDLAPAHLLYSSGLGAPPTTRPYVPPPYTPTANLEPTQRTSSTAPTGPPPTYHFTPSPAAST